MESESESSTLCGLRQMQVSRGLRTKWQHSESVGWMAALLMICFYPRDSTLTSHACPGTAGNNTAAAQDAGMGLLV